MNAHLSIIAGILLLPLTCGTALAFEYQKSGAYGRPFAFGRFYQYDTKSSQWDDDFPYRVSEEQFGQKTPMHDGLTRYYRKPHHQPESPYPRYNSLKLYRDSTGGTPPDRNPATRIER